MPSKGGILLMNHSSTDLVYMALGAVLIALCSWITVPAAVPFTMQTFAVFFILSALGGKRGTVTILVYIALGAAGDLNQYGRRDNILLIREDADGSHSYHRLDLASADLLKSPYFYLQQNDVIYVSPNDVRQSNAGYDQNNSFKMQIVSSTISAISVITTLIIALVIK